MIVVISGDERLTGSTETSSPVIKVYGAMEADADRKSPYGAWATGRKSEANGVSE